MVKVEQITAVPVSRILEGPHWDLKYQCLYFNDIQRGLIFRYDPATDKCYQASIEGEPDIEIGFIVPVQYKQNQFIIGADNKLYVIEWDGVSKTAKKLSTYVEVEQDVEVTRFNDGKVGPLGQLFAGTIRKDKYGDVTAVRLSSFYRIDKGGAVTKLKSDVCVSNGLAWNQTKNKFYYIDSADGDIKEYDYNPDTGAITNQSVLIDFKPASFAPDGMTIDVNGDLFVATFNGGKVLKINPVTRKVVQEIEIPNVSQVTSVTFGGEQLDELFVTTAALNGQAAPAGGLFKITGLGTKGMPALNAKI